MADLERCVNLFVGQLDADELAAFKRAVKEGKARYDYSGPGGLLGLAKVKLLSAYWQEGDDA